MILRKLGVEIFRNTHKILNVVWRLPEPYWIKINIDGATLGPPSLASGRGIFYNSMGFVKGCCPPFG